MSLPIAAWKSCGRGAKKIVISMRTQPHTPAQMDFDRTVLRADARCRSTRLFSRALRLARRHGCLSVTAQALAASAKLLRQVQRALAAIGDRHKMVALIRINSS